MVYLFLLFILGTLVGSFLNVCIYRLPRHESISYPPSHCPNCNTQLKTRDLWPILSQIVVRGKCRYCQTPFSWRYASIEFLTGILFVLVGLQGGNLTSLDLTAGWSGDPVKLIRDLIFIATLTVIFWVDYDTHLVQLEAAFLLGLGGFGYDLYRALTNQEFLTDGKFLALILPARVPESVLAAFVTALMLFAVRGVFSFLYKREAMGFGDVIIVAGIAANLGWNATLVTMFFLASTVGSMAGIGLQIPKAIAAFHRGKRRFSKYGGAQSLPCALARRRLRAPIAFGPMLAIGAVVAFLYGNSINSWYMRTVYPDFESESAHNHMEQNSQRASAGGIGNVVFALPSQ